MVSPDVSVVGFITGLSQVVESAGNVFMEKLEDSCDRLASSTPLHSTYRAGH